MQFNKLQQSVIKAAYVLSTVTAAANYGQVFVSLDELNPETRKLAPQEIAKLEPIFHDQIDYSAVTLHNGHHLQRYAEILAPVIGVEDASTRSATFGNDIYIAEDDNDPVDIDDFGLPDDGLQHEMTHVWQYQSANTPGKKAQLLFDGVKHFVKGGFQYDALYTADDGKVTFSKLNHEAQAMRVQNYYNKDIDSYNTQIVGKNQSQELGDTTYARVYTQDAAEVLQDAVKHAEKISPLAKQIQTILPLSAEHAIANDKTNTPALAAFAKNFSDMSAKSPSMPYFKKPLYVAFSENTDGIVFTNFSTKASSPRLDSPSR